MIRNVTWITDVLLPCTETANVVLCLNLFTIPAQLSKTYSNTCPCEYLYTFTYDDADLPIGYLEASGPLVNEDINDVFCAGCREQWVQELIDEALAVKVITGNDGDEELVIPATDPIDFVSGMGILIDLEEPNQVIISQEFSEDLDNQLVLGSDGQPYVAPSLNQLDGWWSIPDVWTYASATTINVPAGALLRYAKGDKFKFNNPATKYGYIIDVADTLLTVQAGSTFSVANSDINQIFLSKVLTPVGFPEGFDWTTIFTGFSILPIQDRLYTLIGNRVFVDVVNSGAAGTSNATGFTQTGPVVAMHTTVQGGNIGYDNALFVTDVLSQIVAASNVISLFLEGGDGTLWTNTGDKQATYKLNYSF